MGMSKYQVHDSARLRDTHGSFQDWNYYASGNEYTTTTAGSGAASVGSGADGILTYSPTDSTQNREVYVATTNAIFAITANKALMCEFMIQYTEQNTNQAIIAVGFGSGVGSAYMQNTTGAPPSSFTGAIIYKTPGSLVWQTCSSVGSTQNLNTSTQTTQPANNAYQILRIEIMPVSSTIAEVTYYVNDVQLLLAGGRPGQNYIKDQLTYTGAAAMQLFGCCKNGSTTPEQLKEDYRFWEQKRGPLYNIVPNPA